MEGTIIEQVMAARAVRGTCAPGEIIECEVDLLMVHEMLGDQISRVFKEAGFDHVHDPSKVVAILDHWIPASSVESAKIHQAYRSFVQAHGIENDLGMTRGVCHVAIPEAGFVQPGMLVVGSDSHTTSLGALNCVATGMGATDCAVILATGRNWFRVPETVKFSLSGRLGEWVTAKDVALHLLSRLGTRAMNYKAMEMHLETPESISVPGRFTIANMGVEMGAKCTTFPSDRVLDGWLKEKGITGGHAVHASPKATYEASIDVDLADIEPLVAAPHSPANVKPVGSLVGEPVDQVFIGSCTNGRLEDLELAARVLGDRQVHDGTRCIVIPASRHTYLSAIEAGLVEKFTRAGAIVEYPTCGPCMGGHMGILGPGETCISTSNRNFKGRMGAATSRVFLASPATAMASAVAGSIADPREIVKHPGDSRR